MDFGERLKYFREKKGLTQQQLADSIGVAKSTITGYEKGNREPDVLKIKKILLSLNITANDLLGINIKDSDDISEEHKNIIYKYRNLDVHGKDMVNTVLNKEYERHTESIKPKLKETSIQNPKVIEFDPEEVETITLKHSEYKASAGTGYILFDDCREEDLKVIFNNLTRKADICIDVYGNSMEPKYHDKDILLVRKQPDVEIGEIGIFIIDDKGFVKKKGTEGLISINKDYDIIPKSEDIKCFGKVLGVLEKEWIV